MSDVTIQGILKIIRETMDDERFYQARFRGNSISGEYEPNTDELYEATKREAEEIEKTVGCVTTVIREDTTMMGLTDYEDIILYAILPRHIDVELFHQVIEQSRYRMLTELHSD